MTTVESFASAFDSEYNGASTAATAFGGAIYYYKVSYNYLAASKELKSNPEVYIFFFSFLFLIF
jgi:hypothetical protein